jgi:hypothetical protein
MIAFGYLHFVPVVAANEKREAPQVAVASRHRPSKVRLFLFLLLFLFISAFQLFRFSAFTPSSSSSDLRPSTSDLRPRSVFIFPEN